MNWNNGQSTLTFQTQNPSTSLTPGHVNQTAFTGAPYEVLGGTVNFNLSRDEFSFFSTRAYGITAGSAQNFPDFELEPHNWLRLTVTPDLENRLVNVAFNVMMLNGQEVPFCPRARVRARRRPVPAERVPPHGQHDRAGGRAPGLLDPLQLLVLLRRPCGRGHRAGDPLGRGRGLQRGVLRAVAHQHLLRDVDFVDYTAQISIAHEPHAARHDLRADGQHHGPPAASSRRDLRGLESTVRTSPSLTRVPLRGTVYGSVYRASDVTIVGPNMGAMPVASFTFPNVDLTNPASTTTYTIPTALPVGSYQILGFIDDLGTADPSNPSPATNEPVTLPIGAYTMACARQPATVEFALLLPAGQ